MAGSVPRSLSYLLQRHTGKHTSRQTHKQGRRHAHRRQAAIQERLLYRRSDTTNLAYNEWVFRPHSRARGGCKSPVVLRDVVSLYGGDGRHGSGGGCVIGCVGIGCAGAECSRGRGVVGCCDEGRCVGVGCGVAGCCVGCDGGRGRAINIQDGRQRGSGGGWYGSGWYGGGGGWCGGGRRGNGRCGGGYGRCGRFVGCGGVGWRRVVGCGGGCGGG